MKEVILIFRKPFSGQFSIEYLFYNVSSYLKNLDVPVINHQLTFFSKGVLNRILNVLTLTVYKKKIIHITGDVHYAILGAWFSKRVLTIHDFGFMDNKNLIARKIYWLLWIYLPVKFSHKVTVISQYTKAELLSYVKVNDNKVTVIGDFIDAIYKPIKKQAHQPHIPRLLQVGTTYNKNIERLIEAVTGLNCVLVIIGKLSDPLLQLLQDSKINYENRYDLSIKELYQEYAESDLLCYVSTNEGFGMPIIEAQSTGIPVITSNCSCMPDTAGKGALLVDPLDSKAIRSGIERILFDADFKRSLLMHGFKNVRRFSKENIANEYLQLYYQL